VRKPNVNEFVRVNPDPAMSLATSIFVDPERETYFVAPGLRSVLVAGVKAMLLLATVNQRGVFFLWPIALGDGTGRRNAWHETAPSGNGSSWSRICRAAAPASGCQRNRTVSATRAIDSRRRGNRRGRNVWLWPKANTS
jgi:hypothetical protein